MPLAIAPASPADHGGVRHGREDRRERQARTQERNQDHGSRVRDPGVRDPGVGDPDIGGEGARGPGVRDPDIGGEGARAKASPPATAKPTTPRRDGEARNTARDASQVNREAGGKDHDEVRRQGSDEAGCEDRHEGNHAARRKGHDQAGDRPWSSQVQCPCDRGHRRPNGQGRGEGWRRPRHHRARRCESGSRRGSRWPSSSRGRRK